MRIYRAEDGLEQWRAEALDNERQFLEYQIEDPDRNIGGEWWSTPFANGTTETTRARDGIGALGVFLEEDSSSNEARVQPVRIYGAPRIYEITGPQDWANLVDTYPLPVPASRRSVLTTTRRADVRLHRVEQVRPHCQPPRGVLDPLFQGECRNPPE